VQALEADGFIKGYRAQLDAEVKKQGSRFVEQAHTFIREFKDALCGDKRKCVLIMDSLEQVRGYGKNLDDVYASLEQLFIGERQALNLPDIHVVYSISPFLYVRNAHLPALYGAGVIVNMPSVHVFIKQLNEVKPDPEGLVRMREFMSARFPRWTQVFKQTQIDRLILGSGGDLRDFLRAVAHASLADTDSLPLPDKEIDEALSKIKPPYESIHASHLIWLQGVEISHEAAASDAVSAVEMFQYLASKHVLTYLNGETWYSVHPLLRDWVLAKRA
jgi:DNA-binding Lrp family transcriptional regulator